MTRIRKPVVKEPLRECVQKTAEQQVIYSKCSSCHEQLFWFRVGPFICLVCLLFLVTLLYFSSRCKCCVFLIQKVQVELEGLKKDLNKVSEKSQEVLASPQPSASTPVLRSELDLTVQKMDHAYMLSSVYLDK